jgi:FlaA1/EpsC-like NDP-sugar epimerase
METNPAAGVPKNAIATRRLALVAGESHTKIFVLVPTDKAGAPATVMGASKRMAEIVVQDLDQKYATNYVAVRFGNVLGSAGSVVPIFREQIRRGDALTVTHKDMTRYFMTIPEASQLVLQAGALGEGGEIFILDMGQPVRIVELAEDMIRLSGLTPYEDIDIEFTGIRHGEKLFEELEITGENLLRTRNPKIFIGKIATYSRDEIARVLDGFARAVAANDERAIRHLFNEFLPEANIEERDAGRVTELAMNDDDAFVVRPSKLGLAEK